MRHLSKDYPYQKPSKNRSSKNLNIFLGPASVFPAYKAWSDKALAMMASKCKNKDTNCFQEELNARKLARETKKIQKKLKAQKKEATTETK